MKELTTGLHYRAQNRIEWGDGGVFSLRYCSIQEKFFFFENCALNTNNLFLEFESPWKESMEATNRFDS